MNTTILSSTVVPSLIAAAILAFLSLGLVSAEVLAGGATVLTLLGIAALEYRLSWKRLLR